MTIGKVLDRIFGGSRYPESTRTCPTLADNPQGPQLADPQVTVVSINLTSLRQARPSADPEPPTNGAGLGRGGPWKGVGPAPFIDMGSIPL